MRKGLKDRVKAAVEQDNTILTERVLAHTHPGKTDEYMQYLGLSVEDLKRLERAGLALRGYTQNVWTAGQKMPDGRVVEDNPFVTYRGKGHRRLWVLVGDRE